MQQNIKERILYLDLLRVLATFAVIYLHICTSELHDFSISKNWFIEIAGESLVRWCVPMFVMISGALLLIPSKNLTYRDILTARIPRLLIAYVFWSFVYYFVFWYQGGFSIRGLLLSHFHLWFLPMLMGVYLLIPFLRNIVMDNTMMYYALAIWLFFVLISSFRFLSIIKMMNHFYVLFDTNIVVGYSGYFLLGYFLSQQSFSKRQRIWIYLFGIGGALVTVFGTYFISNSKGEEDTRFFSNLSIQVIAMSSALFVLVKELAPNRMIRRQSVAEQLIRNMRIDFRRAHAGVAEHLYCFFSKKPAIS